MSQKLNDLLIEIGTEELPPKALKKLAIAFSTQVRSQIEMAELAFEHIQWFATPRRLALLITNLQATQVDKKISRKGPAVAAAYDKQGNPSKAALGFAKSCGVEFDQLQTTKSDKGEWLSFDVQQKGLSVKELLPEFITKALDQLPIPKRMRWGSGDVTFVRPIHWITLLFGGKKIGAHIYGIKTGDQTYGHRFHHPEAIQLEHASDYENRLAKQGKVIANFDTRQQQIRELIEDMAKKANGKAVVDEALLDEVTSMIERPNAILGSFDRSFLDVPSEALVSAMKNHQKYFHLVDNKGKLLPNFIAISNIKSKDPKQIQTGNERVIRPRLADAQFFWQQDKKRPLDSMVDALKSVTFQHKLGSLYDKTQRVKRLARHIANQLQVDATLVERAAHLAKADLMSDMVGEFPELQGTMGYYYAMAAKENPEVAIALDQHYRPRFSGDLLPESHVAQALALADKIDTLVGIFGIGKTPTGDKDPFGLRRTALGCVRILIEKQLPLDISQLIDISFSIYTDSGDGAGFSVALSRDTKEILYDFILGRVEVHYANLGFTPDIIESVACLNLGNLGDFDKRINALKQFLAMSEAQSLAAANKRISNILKKSDTAQLGQVDHSRLQEPAEIELAHSLDSLVSSLDPLIQKANYRDAMKKLSALKTPVDRFFDSVMVMDENMELRHNRLALLKSLRDQFLKIADISRLQQQ